MLLIDEIVNPISSLYISLPMKRIIVAILILICFGIAWQMLSIIKIKVVGQPNSTGILATQVEQPFFASLQKETGLPIEIEFKSLDTLGVKDTHQLPMMRDGVFDLASLRLIQNSQNEVTLNGLDLTGLNLSIKKGHALADAYLPIVDKHLQEKYQVKVLGLWSFGPQELFCKNPITRMSDLKGLKVRVAGELLGDYIASFGAIAAIIPFDETRAALQNGLVDCAISSAASASSAGWLEYVKYYIPISFNTGINAYVITLLKWNLLSETQQQTLQTAFDKHISNMWAISEDIYSNSQDCLTGKDACKNSQKYKLIRVDIPSEDLTYLKLQAKAISYKKWSEACNKEYPGCGEEWLRIAGPVADIQ
ncbi:TRAP transporter substrate-binding protein DctP [Polynucleobacter alcilacus]|uniref:TRAP transporter substrate-binding protein DctP n=1 Tax=Polynucleobacter alcilacus TaxID=1819739 RepID=UPI001C0B1F6E|nr:TRAP transporter substrate-binding protein DctP [Polynucleobacter alcilacus]MBU3568331.1 TRAP transporter substrate-binding protein DctP [Polynucleobacter alcilacus]